MSLDVEKVMRQVMRHAAGMQSSGIDQSFPRWEEGSKLLPQKAEYTLGEMLAFSDAAFVRNAYAVILRRAPDTQGANDYLDALRNGHITKVEALGFMRWSEEGRSHDVHIDGLLVPFKLQRAKRLQLVGPIIEWLHALIRMPVLLSRAQMQTDQHAQKLQSLGSAFNQLSVQAEDGLANLQQANGAQHEHLEMLEERIEFQRVEHEKWQSYLRDFEGSTHASFDSLQSSLAASIHALQVTTANSFTILQAELEAAAIAASPMDCGPLTGGLGNALTRLRHRVDRHAWNLGLDFPGENTQQFNASLDPFYVALEERFRGSRELIRARVMPYLDIVRQSGAGTPEAPVLDIACGRGDWLDVLREQQLIARGVDSNSVFVRDCLSRGLDVLQADVLVALSELKDESVGLITGMHIAEHLPFTVLLRLIDECKRVLRPGGILILETPNPENWWVATLWFYFDPTHRNPLPPEALRWMVEARGFETVQVERLIVARDINPPALLPPEASGAESINTVLAQLHAAPDYAVIGHKGKT